MKQYLAQALRRFTGRKPPPSRVSERIAVLHIPKTAGTSLRNLIEHSCANANLLYYYPSRLVSEVARYPDGLLIGHFEFGYEDQFFNDCDRVTFLRPPLARTASQLKYTRRYYTSSDEPEDQEYRAWFAHNDLLSFIEYSRLWYFDNAMVRMLSSNAYNLPFGEVAQQHLELAMQNLDRFNFVGFQDDFKRSLDALCARYEWPKIEFESNISEEQDADVALDVAELERYNEYDLALYEYARSRYS